MNDLIRIYWQRAAMMAIFLTLTAPFGHAQGGPWSQWGRVLASAFSHWSVVSQTAVPGPGSYVLEIDVSNPPVIAGGPTIQPLNINAPLLVDPGPNQELAKPTAIDCSWSPGACRITLTLSRSHAAGFRLVSGTAGLQEAIDFAAAAGKGTVVIDSSWTGQPSQITAAHGYTGVLIQDQRRGHYAWYGWSGSVYLPQLAISDSSVTLGTAQTGQINGVLNATQYPGGDPGAQVNAAEAACPDSGCTIDLRDFSGDQNISTPIVLSKPTILLFGYAQFDCSSVAQLPCIRFQAGLSGIEGPEMGTGPTGNYGANLRYAGEPAAPGAVIQFEDSNADAEIGYCFVHNFFAKIIDTSNSPPPVPELDALEAVNPVGFSIENFFVHHDSLNYAPRNNSNDPIVGIHLKSTSGSLVPQPGFTHVNNFLDTNDDANGVEVAAPTAGSAGIWIEGVPGTTNGIGQVSVSGFCNIEDSTYGIRIDHSAENTLDDGCLIQGAQWPLYLDHAHNNTFRFLRSNQAQSANYLIDTESYDNSIWFGDFISGPPGQDKGQRTTWYDSSDGFVQLPYLAGPLNGASASASANVNSSSPSFAGNYWNGSANAVCSVAAQLTFAAGTNPQTQLLWNPTGCPATMPTYVFQGAGLDARTTGGTDTWQTTMDGQSRQTGDVTFDADQLASPAASVRLSGTPTGKRVWTFPDRSDTVAGLGAQTFSGLQDFAAGLTINGDAALTAAPRMLFSAFTPGLTTATAVATWTPDRSITVTRIQAQAQTAPLACANNAVVRLSDGSGSNSLTITGAANDSGPISQNAAAGATLTLIVATAASGCNVTPANLNILVQYRMN